MSLEPAAATVHGIDTILGGLHVQGDRVIRWALAAHALIAVFLAQFYGTWAITIPVTAVAVGMFVVASNLLPGAFLTRCVAGISLQVFCALHIHQLHGLAEMHFFFFTGFTLMIVYADWLAMWPGALLIIGQHIVFAVLTNAGVPVAFFPEAYVGVTKLAFHFGIALLHVAICGYFAHLHRRHTVVEYERRRDIAQFAAMAEEANHSKSVFLANMSHEIRTPLTAILGYADLLLDPGTGASEREFMVGTVRRNGQHLLAVINDILDISKIEAGKLQIESLPCAVRDLLAEVTSALRVRAEAKELRLETVCTSRIPDRITTDPTRLRQILLNLGGNAIKFTESGGVRFEVAFRPGPASDQGHLVVAVVDSGIGLDPEVARGLFEPFRQADASTSRKYGGTGLGLAISKRLANALGGDITVLCAKGRGCRFELTIATGPVAQAGFADHPIAEAPEAPAPHSGHAQPLRGRILLAEDGPDNQRLIRRMLERAGASVEVAGNGRVAVTKFREARCANRPYDLVLMDMQMPELDGYAATGELRQAGFATPIIAVTAHAMNGDRERCLAAGCDGYLTKPIDRVELVTACERALGAASVP